MRIETRLAPDVVALARRLRGRPGLAVLRSDPRGAIRPDDAATSFVGSDPVEVVRTLAPPVDPHLGNARGWAGRPAAPRWVGWVPYEGMRSLERAAWTRHDLRPAPFVTEPRWHRYDALLRVDHRSGTVVVEADELAAARRLLARLDAGTEAPATVTLGPIASGPDVEHASGVRRVLELIAAGDAYQVNLARRFVSSFHGCAFSLFERLFTRAPAPYGLFLDAGDVVLVGTSPELALEIRGAHLRTGPIKGTRPRGAHATTDAEASTELDASEKERAELTMVVDLHRNDLGRVAFPGSVRVTAPGLLRASPTLWSRLAEVRAVRAPTVELAAVFEAMLPCGSVTGAPKVRAMEIIADLESARRGLYTGAYGWVGPGGDATLAVAIRTAVLRREHGADDTGELEYFAGGGIVWGSDPERETEETHWKARGLFAVGGAKRSVPPSAS